MTTNKDVPTQTRAPRSSPERMITDNDLKILWVARTLTNIDLQYGEDLLKLDCGDMEPDRKNRMKCQLLLQHRERREPYRKLLESLRA